MRSLDRKLFRDLWRMKGQALAIAFVVAGGVATYVLSASTLDSLRTTKDKFYSDFRFAEAFVSLKRAPEAVRARIEEIPGVQMAQTRVTVPANLDLPVYPDPISALIVSIPDGGQPEINRLYLKAGRLPEGGREDEAVVSDAFAEAHRLEPGATLSATINGRRRRLVLTGIAISPEFIYQLQPGSLIPDFKSYAILWMGRGAVESAFRMKGSFNEMALLLERDAVLPDVVAAMDRILEPYGGLGAYGRADQTSNRYLSEEFRQLTMMATLFPAIFLSVAAFLLNVVLSRLMTTQRSQIAILKAFGYTTPSIVVHFLKLTALVVLLGVLLGLAGGAWMGHGMSQMYTTFYRFPYLAYILRPPVVITGALISLGAAMLGTIYAVIRAAGEAPASAMQPATPGNFRLSLVERIGLGQWISQPTRMILRNVERRPVKALLSVIGVALSGGILLLGGFWGDSIDFMVYAQFKQAQRDDMTVTFTEAISAKGMYSLTSLPGVWRVEPFRNVAARLRNGHRSYRTAVQGLPEEARLRRLLEQDFQQVRLPAEGIVLTDYLAEILNVQVGEMLTVETLEGNRAVRTVPVAGLVREYVGVAAYMDLGALNRMMREGHAISGVYLAADSAWHSRIFSELRKMPVVAATTVRRRMLTSFYETMAQQMLIFALFNTILAATIAIGVVYNTARISLAERSRELASLRVLGYTRGEISFILLGELTLIVLVAIPLGWWIGTAMATFMATRMQTDLFRVPIVLATKTYTFASLVVLVAAAASGLIVRRLLDRLDLVEVLKARE